MVWICSQPRRLSWLVLTLGQQEWGSQVRVRGRALPAPGLRAPGSGLAVSGRAPRPQVGAPHTCPGRDLGWGLQGRVIRTDPCCLEMGKLRLEGVRARGRGRRSPSRVLDPSSLTLGASS